MQNPILADVTRGGAVESRHAGAYAVTGPDGGLIASAGDIGAPVFPRSAIKAFQCLPVIESGAAERFGLIDEEIALCCSSHNGEADHVRVARAILAKAGLEESAYECGAHWPYEEAALHGLIRAGESPSQVHNNCSGKHAGMLAVSLALGAAPAGYINVDHAVQRASAEAINALCDVDVAKLVMGIDGCSIPTWAIPLRNIALGFSRFASGRTLSPARRKAAQRIIAACRAHPFMVAGTGGFCTRLMEAVPRAFVKVGAEGVYCGCVPHAGIGIALKIDDGASRAAEVAMAELLAGLDVWTGDERALLRGLARSELRNWRKVHVGDVGAAALGASVVG
jgi:L-asparaginase II